jgi:surface antigen
MITLNPIKQTLTNKIRTKRISIAAMVVLMSTGLVFNTVYADQYDQKISQLQTTNSSLQAQNNTLAQEAVGFQATINNLAAQISTLEAQIRANEAERHQLEAEIAHHKAVLGTNIKAMYLEGEISTFEILASSNDLGSFVDKEQYRNEVKDKISETINKINDLKKKLEKVIADQKAAQTQLDKQRAEQARLLALNESQRAALDAQMKSNSSEISKLRSQQAAANARLFGNGVRNVADNSGYPYANAPFPNSIVDPWGMYQRQCVSYTAWKVANSGRHMPYWGGVGNANQWDDNARAAGIPVDGSPRVGDVAVSNTGTYGHVMYVEAVFGDGTIYVSQYNASWTGRYSEARINIGSLVFIHF